MASKATTYASKMGTKAKSAGALQSTANNFFDSYYKAQELQLKRQELEMKSKQEQGTSLKDYIATTAGIKNLVDNGVLPPAALNAYLSQMNGIGSQISQVPQSAPSIVPQQPSVGSTVQSTSLQKGLGVVGSAPITPKSKEGIAKAVVQKEAMIPLETQQIKEKARAENMVEQEQLQPRIKSVYQDFNDALDEVQTKAPDALKSGFTGYLARTGLKIGSSKFIDEYPAVATLSDNLKADATAFAKAAGEQRPTDVDIERFLATLLDPRERSLETNISKANSQKRRLENQGFNTEWMVEPIKQMESKRFVDAGNGIKIREIK
jgi:hypothetical protein